MLRQSDYFFIYVFIINLLVRIVKGFVTVRKDQFFVYAVLVNRLFYKITYQMGVCVTNPTQAFSTRFS